MDEYESHVTSQTLSLREQGRWVGGNFEGSDEVTPEVANCLILKSFEDHPSVLQEKNFTQGNVYDVHNPEHVLDCERQLTGNPCLATRLALRRLALRAMRPTSHAQSPHRPIAQRPVDPKDSGKNTIRPILNYSVTVGRKPSYYEYNVMLPVVAITTMCFSTFSVDHRCDDAI